MASTGAVPTNKQQLRFSLLRNDGESDLVSQIHRDQAKCLEFYFPAHKNKIEEIDLPVGPGEDGVFRADIGGTLRREMTSAMDDIATGMSQLLRATE